MKRSLIVFICLACYNISFAQTDRGSIGLVRINGTANFYNSVHYYDNNSNQRNGTAGFSAELGAKQFLGKTPLFIEEMAGFTFSDLPFPEHPYMVGAPIKYPNLAKGNETGLFSSLVLGYQIPLKNNINIELFAGPSFRYLLKYNAKMYDGAKVDLPFHKANLRLKAGANLNIKNFNISLFASPDLLDRGKLDREGKDVYKYRSIMVGVGIGYYFKWRNVWNYLSTVH